MAAVHVRRLRNRHRRRRNLPRPRVFRDRLNPLESLDDEELFDKYRFRRPTITFILNGIHNFLHRETRRNFALSPVIQLLLFLRFVATGTHLSLVGDSLCISESATGRACRDVCQAIITVFRNIICFPVGEKAIQVMEGFRRIAGFPNVLGCIDGTFVKIISPHENEADFVNRKGVHSLNIQMVCDPNFRVTSMCAKWPGSVHDSRIFRTSGLCQQFENGIHQGLLLGDSGYPCTKYLMTPYLSPANNCQGNFNRALCRTRVLIKQTFGILKRRFNCLHDGFRTTPEQSVKYITSCVILHDIGINHNDIIINNNIEEIAIGDCRGDINMNPTFDGTAKRNDIARQFF
ncbi:putative nuclease HARBI1 isoform X1 [Mytilus californianus]|uniref:putative nuclease HARBI1 isoform X1 n=2 Tax=Mytilus californianus TaxID=6549 RepID=UPI00224657C6|nr:putative nuclease HARBI1 isoform X1 [Mytilus californianus]